MRTDDLIRALAADSKPSAMTPERALGCALIAGGAAAAGLFLATIGVRPHLMSHLGDPRVPFKIGIGLLLAYGASALVLRLVRPGANPFGAAMLVASVPILLAAANLGELLTVPADEWGRRLVGTNAIACLISIPLLSLVPLAAAVLALRQGAPDNPGLAGACAGLLAGAIGATLYATHCTDDSPFFVAVWYSAGIAMVVAIGAACGSRCLRW